MVSLSNLQDGFLRKRPKVSAIRMFSDGCRGASEAKSREGECGMLGANLLKENVSRDGVLVSGVKPREDDHGKLGANLSEGNARTDGVLMSQVKLKERGHGILGANISKETSRINFPSRKYPPPRILKGLAVQRDFPIGCGDQKLPNGKSSVDMDDPRKSTVVPRMSIIDMDDFRNPIENVNDPRLSIVDINHEKSMDVVPLKVMHRIDSNSMIEMSPRKSVVDIKPLIIGIGSSSIVGMKRGKVIIDTKPLMVGIDSKAMLGMKTSNSMVGMNPRKSMVDITTLEVMHRVDSNRNKVKKALHSFQEVFTKLVEDVPSSTSKFHIRAAMVLRRQFKWINTSRRLGAILGVQRGDMFQWMAELNIIGLHRQFENGIDYMKVNGKILATSVVASNRYSNDLGSSDFLIYSGQGGNPLVKGDQPIDQELKRGNLALKNSMEAKKLVRVIRCYNISKSSNLIGVSGQKLFKKMYVYDGLYYVDRYWQERGRFGKQVFMFLLKRGQPEKLSQLKNFTFQEWKDSLLN